MVRLRDTRRITLLTRLVLDSSEPDGIAAKLESWLLKESQRVTAVRRAAAETVGRRMLLRWRLWVRESVCGGGGARERARERAQ